MKKLPKALYQGELTIAGFKMNCYNLDDGERVISREGLMRALGRTGNPTNKEDISTEENALLQTPVFLSAKNIKEFISNELLHSSQPIVFSTENNPKVYGYRAGILPLICYVYIDAENKKVLNKNQKLIAERSHILIRGLATVGIIALVDEATGYQYSREKNELQKILQAYISPELLPWQKRFPDEFYKEIFRLNKWDYTVSGIKKRPGIIGTWTKNLVYNLLPKGVLKALEDNTPKSSAGNKTARLHQSLTIDIGEPHLEKQLISVITLMNISTTWKEFEKHFVKKFQNELLTLPLQSRSKSQKQNASQGDLFAGIDIDVLFPKVEPEANDRKENDKPEKLNLFDKQLKGLLSVPPPNKNETE